MASRKKIQTIVFGDGTRFSFTNEGIECRRVPLLRRDGYFIVPQSEAEMLELIILLLKICDLRHHTKEEVHPNPEQELGRVINDMPSGHDLNNMLLVVFIDAHEDFSHQREALVSWLRKIWIVKENI